MKDKKIGLKRGLSVILASVCVLSLFASSVTVHTSALGRNDESD